MANQLLGKVGKEAQFGACTIVKRQLGVRGWVLIRVKEAQFGNAIHNLNLI